MLGIRRSHGVAIDLWQGDAARFVNDLKMRFSQSEATDFCVRLVADARELKVRHVAVVVSEDSCAEDHAQKFFTALTAALKQNSDAASPKRITLIMPNLAAYTVYQSALFAGVPEI